MKNWDRSHFEGVPDKVVERLALGGPWGFRWEVFDPRAGPQGSWFKVAERVLAAQCRVVAVFECDYIENPFTPEMRWGRVHVPGGRDYEVKVQTYAVALNADTMEDAQRYVQQVTDAAAQELERRKRGDDGEDGD